MSDKLRKVALVSGFLGVALVTVGWALMHPRIHDRYRFLEGSSIAYSGVTRPFSGSAQEIRTYTWKQPWQEVVTEVRSELKGSGLNEWTSKDSKHPVVSWSDRVETGGLCPPSSDLSIYVQPGKSVPLLEMGDITDNDPEWVTVAISSALDETWVNVIRYTFFPIPEK